MSEGSACRHLVTRLGKVPKFHMETCRHLSDCERRCVGGDGQAGQPAAQPALFLCSPRERLPRSQERPPHAASASLRVHTAADSSSVQPAARSFHQDIAEPTPLPLALG